ncbi:MAG: lipoyl(octanoyl) transferase LipB [Syntrophobacteraceae bacterium]|nr:lipoyl(octanoyl) transferase LipB [Syntrophobacteraceae bacterium]
MPKSFFCAEFSLLTYQEARRLQIELVAARKSGDVSQDILLLLEHSPVFTVGRRGGRGNLLVSESFLAESSIAILDVERGGDITFHGPGQLVGYPIIDLRAAGFGVVDYVEKLEEVMIRTAARYGVEASRNPVNRGTWVGNSKLGSIGVAVRSGITFHGFAFNVNVSLAPFGWINPCGLQGIGMTSLERELSRTLPMGEVRERLKGEFEAVFQVKLKPADFAFSGHLFSSHLSERDNTRHGTA